MFLVIFYHETINNIVFIDEIYDFSSTISHLNFIFRFPKIFRRATTDFAAFVFLILRFLKILFVLNRQ